LQTKEQNEADRQARIDKFYKENTPKGDRDRNAIGDLTKAEQESFILDLGITRKKLKSLTNEEDRINYIILKGLQQGLDLELEAENYIKPKKERSQTYKDLAELKKSEQVDLLIRLGITRRELKAANNEEKRIELIIKKEQQKTNKNKQNSLK
jgi:hypothetical protein